MPFSYEINPDEASRRRRRSSRDDSSNERIEYKALGVNIGSLARGTAVFDPNAYDGDGDGVVQDGTPFERPAVLSNIVGVAREGLASATPTGVFSGGMSDLVGLSNSEVAKRVVPDNPADFLERRLRYSFTGELSTSPSLDNVSFDPDDVARAREMVERTLDERPALRATIDRFGCPPIAATTGDNTYSGKFVGDAILVAGQYLFDGPEDEPWILSDSQLRASTIFPFIEGVNNVLVGEELGDIFTHEWGHYLHRLAIEAHPDKDVRDVAALLYSRDWKATEYDPDKAKDKLGLGEFWKYWDKAGVKSGTSPHERPGENIPFVNSAYGSSSPVELVAESVLAYFSPDEVKRQRLNRAGRELIETFLGVESKGLASTSGRKTSTGSSLEGKTPSEIADIVVPKNIDEALAMVDDHVKLLATESGAYEVDIETLKHAFLGGTDAFDFSPEAQETLRGMVIDALSKNPLFLDVVQRHGFPPLMITKRGTDWNGDTDTSAISMIEGFPAIIWNADTLQEALDGKRTNMIYEQAGFLDGTYRFCVSERIDAVLAHEWAHYLNRNALANHPDPEIRKLAGFWWSDTYDIDPQLGGFAKILIAMGATPEDKFSQRVIGARKFAAKVAANKAEKWNGYPHVMSQYGQTMPAETFAEGVTAIIIDDRELRDMVSPQLRDDIFDIMGKPRRYSRDIARGVDENRAGLASISLNRDSNGDREFVIAPNTSPGTDSPMNGRDWLKDATDDEIAEALAATSFEDAINLMFMNMGYGLDMGLFTPVERQIMKAELLQALFGSASTSDLVPVDFTPAGIDRTRNIILRAVQASPIFGHVLRTFGSPPIFSIDPATLSRLRQDQIDNGTLILNPLLRGDSVMGWSTNVYSIILNTAGWAGRKDFDIGQRARATHTYHDRSGRVLEMIDNVDMSMPGTLYHEWFHSFWSRVTGWHASLGISSSSGSLPGDRQSRLDYMFPNDPIAAIRAKTIKETFDIRGFIPYSDGSYDYVQKMIVRSRRTIEKNGDDPTDYDQIMSNYASILQTDRWNPEYSQILLEVIEARYPYLTESLAPLIRGGYATASRQEQFAEMGTLFVTPDARERSTYLTPEMESLIAFVLGLKDDKSVGDYDKPWLARTTGESVDVDSAKVITETVEQRIQSPKDTFISRGTLEPKSDVVKVDAGMVTISTGGYKFSVDGEIFDTPTAHGAWSDWQENWRMRYISAEMLGIEPNAVGTDISRWQSITNKHLIDRDVDSASSEVKDEISRSAMMALSIMRDISDGGQVSDEFLYHGVNNLSDDSGILSADIGESFTIPLTSFSPNQRSTIDALDADEATNPANITGEKPKRVVLKLKPGASVSKSRVDSTTQDDEGNEYSRPIEEITAGEFRIVSRTTDNGVDIVEIEQVGVLDPIVGMKKPESIESAEKAGLASIVRKSSSAIEQKTNIAKSATGVAERTSAIDDVNQEVKRNETLSSMIMSRGDELDKLDAPRTVGGLASMTPLKTRADKHGVSLDAFYDESLDDDDIEWSSNEWSFGKTQQVRAGDVVVVRTRNDGKKELLTIERKSGPFRGAVALPGGLQDGDEDLYDTAEREMLEEVNVSPKDAKSRRILGQIEAKDWDTRFVEGGRIAGIRFDIDEQQSSVVKAGDDANKFNWIDVEELSTGKYPIAFGHASWLAEAFADDPVLGPRFAVLAEASRVRNQRLIGKIDEKRKKAGVKEFGKMPDPSQPYKTTTEGIRTGLASQNKFDRNINVSADVSVLSYRVLSENLNYLTRNPIKDEHYNQEINGVSAKQLLDNLNKGKITHRDAVALYLAVKEISRRDKNLMISPDKKADQQILLGKLRQLVSGKQDHKVVRFTRDGRSSWAAYRGSDYLGDYDTEEEANDVIQLSISERSAGLASVSVPRSRKESGTNEKAKEKLKQRIDAKQEQIKELEELNNRLGSALEELVKDGVWSGEKYNIRVDEGEGLSPTSFTRQELEDFAKENGITFDEYINNLVNHINSAGLDRKSKIDTAKMELEKLQQAFDYIDKTSQNDRSFHIDELLADEDLANELRKRSEMITQMSQQGRSQRFEDPETGEFYVIHWGASRLVGDTLDPKRSRGNDDGKLGAGDTRSLNRMSSQAFAGRVARDESRIKLATELMDRILNGETLERSKLSRSEIGALEYYGLRIGEYEARFPENNERIPDFVDRVKSRIRDSIIPTIEKEKTENEKQKKMVERLEKDDWQFSSTYPASSLEQLFGSYGGRYADEGADIGTASSGDRTPQSPVTGIHIFKVKRGENAWSFGGDGEVHLIGEHQPIASLIADNNSGSSNPAVDTWAGWVDMVIEQDKERSRRGLASRSERVEDFSEQEIERMRERQKELEDMPYQELLPIFSDGEYIYVVHAGSEEIVGNTLTPSRSIGDESRNMSGNTRAINRSMSNRYIKQYEQDRSSRTSLDYIINALRNGEMIENPNAFREQNEGEQGAIQGLSGILFDVGTKDGPYLGTFSRSIRDNKPFPQQEDLDKIGITREELADYLEEVGVPIFDQRIKFRESVVQRLREDDGQFTSGYPLAAVVKRVPIEGYGGRYGGDYDPSKGGSKDRSFDIGTRFDRQGIHIVRARIGSDAAQMSVAPRLDNLESLDGVDSQDLEIHLVGEHEIIASLSTPTWAKAYMAGDESWRLGRDFFKAWAEDVVNQDKENRRGLASTAPSPRGLASTSSPAIQLKPTNDIEEAKATGRPFAPFIPGTMPPKTQAAYDEIVKRRADKVREILEFKEKNKELIKAYRELDWRGEKTTPEMEGAAIKLRQLMDEFAYDEQKIADPFLIAMGYDKIYGNLFKAMLDEAEQLGFTGDRSSWQEDFQIVYDGLKRDLIAKKEIDTIRLTDSDDYDTDEARLRRAEEILDKADIVISFPMRYLDQLIGDGRFKTQFETSTSRGLFSPLARSENDVAHFGYHPSMAPEMRPIFGYLTSGGILDEEGFGSIRQYGEIQFVLKRDVHGRSTYTTADSLSSGLKPSPMGVPSVEATQVASGSSLSSLYSEAQIHGGVSLDDVDYVTVNVGEPSQNWQINRITEDEFVAVSEMLARVGIRVVPVRDGEVIDIWNGGKVMKEDLGPEPIDFLEPKKVVA